MMVTGGNSTVEPIFGSMEAARRLSDVLERIRGSAKFSSFSNTRLGRYWLKGWPRAPFEEELTIKQICELNVDVILRKKSLTPLKVGAIVTALERCFDSQRAATALNSGATAHAAITGDGAPIAAALAPWLASGASIPSYLRAFLGALQQQFSSRPVPAELAAFLQRLATSVKDREIAVLWLLLEHPPQLVAQIFNLDLNQIRLIADRGAAAIGKAADPAKLKPEELVAMLREAARSWDASCRGLVEIVEAALTSRKVKARRVPAGKEVKKMSRKISRKGKVKR